MRIINKEEFKNTAITEIGLSEKTLDALHQVNYETVYQLVEHFRDLPHIRKLSLKGLNEIYECLIDINKAKVSADGALSMMNPVDETAPEMEQHTELQATNGVLDNPCETAEIVSESEYMILNTEKEADSTGRNRDNPYDSEIVPNSDDDQEVNQDIDQDVVQNVEQDVEPGWSQTENESVDVQEEFLVTQELSEETLARPISDLHIPIRLVDSLLWEQIKTIRDVLALDEADIMRLRYFGPLARKQLTDEIILLRETGEEYFTLKEDSEEGSELNESPKTEMPSPPAEPKQKTSRSDRKKHIVPIFGDAIEEDMTVRKSDGSFEERVFAEYPLLGSKIIKPETLETLNKNARKYIDEVLHNPWTILKLRAEMQITLALINNAKKWKSEESGQFWKYIALQFGYRDADGAVVRLLKSSLEDAMKRNHRLFLEDENGREFKATTVIHALATKKSWMALFDFLFDFYKTNLNWKVLPGDPIYGLMIRSLQKKLVGENSEEVKISISSRVYSFQEGIRKLIIYRPVYAKELLEKLISQIDAMVNSESWKISTYEEKLCEEWYREKLIAIAESKKTDRKTSAVQRELAMDYSRIRVRFILQNENKLQLVLPDIRLMSDEVENAALVIDYGNRTVIRQNLGWYGNELGKTLIGESVTMPDFADNEGLSAIRIRIVCNDEVIYDSENTMERTLLVFSGASEINLGQIKKENYTIVIPQGSEIESENIVFTEIDSFKPRGLRAYFVELLDGYVLTINEKLVAFDNDNNSEIRVIPPAESSKLPHITVGEMECGLAYKSGKCSLLLGEAEYLYKFVVLRNSERIELSSLDAVDGSNGIALTCPLLGQNGLCRIQVINLENEKLIFDSCYMLMTSAEYGFNRDFYYSADDYLEAYFYFEIDDVYEEAAFSSEDEEIRIPFRGGVLHAEIPRIRIEETTGAWMDGTKPAWYVPDIPQDSLFKVTNPPKTSIRFSVGGQDIGYDGNGIVSIGNVLQTIGSSGNMGDELIEMQVSYAGESQKYNLARVCFRECFLSRPEFWYENGKLYWNQGGAFIGKQNRIFTLTLYGMGDSVSMQMDADTEYLDLPDTMEIGNYRYEITVLSGGMFKRVRETLAGGECVIGDRNRLRFLNRRIVLDSLTDENQAKAGHIYILESYIDCPEFIGVEETSEGSCPVYRGVLYTITTKGKKYVFSFEPRLNKKGDKLMMVNPVRIVYVGHNTLCITDQDGDGLYYCYFYDRNVGATVYALTDREYAKDNKNRYSTADLYSYRTEGT